MKKFRYLYQNPENLTQFTKDHLYEGERVLYKADEIKFEDEYLYLKINIA